MRHEEHIEVVRDLYCDTVQNPGCVVRRKKMEQSKSGKKKRSIVLRGSLLKPLVVGKCAIIHTGGKLYRTSKVVSIRMQNEKTAYFETENSFYHIRLEPFFYALASFVEYQTTKCAA